MSKEKSVDLSGGLTEAYKSIDANPGVLGHWSTESLPSGVEFRAFLPPNKKRFDWRDHGLSPIVRDQGDWCACTSFAITSVIELRRTLAGLQTPRLSAGYVHYCLIGERDPNEPHSAQEVAAVVQAQGIKPGQVDGPPLTDAQYDRQGSVIRIVGSGYCEPGAGALNALVSEGPLLVEVSLPENYKNIRIHQIYRPDVSSRRILHSMVLMAYDWDAKTITMLGSDGSKWGNQGYLTMTMDDALFYHRWPFSVAI